MSLTKALIHYLLKRFHLIPLTLLVASDILVVHSILQKEVSNITDYVFAFLFVLLFLFHNRVGDDQRDFAFDAKYYPERQVQKGIISLKVLNRLTIITYFLMVLLMLTINLQSLWIGIPLLLFAWWAKKDFYLPETFKEQYFFLYNLLNMLQMLFLQVFIYFALQPFKAFDLLIWMHIAFVFALSLQIEVTRKIHHKKYPANDQYSDRLGVKASIYLWLMFSILSIFLSFYLGYLMDVDWIMLLVFEGLFLVILFFGGYFFNQKASAENLFWLCSILSYIGQNLLLTYG